MVKTKEVAVVKKIKMYTGNNTDYMFASELLEK